MNSCLYECSVYHKRLRPMVREFRYRIFMFALDLDELDAISRKIPLFSRNRWNCYAFNDRDHLNLGRATAKENVIAYAASEGAAFPDGGRIVLVTLPRVLGYIFNPVSFYFCHDSAGNATWSVVEVGNTFREMKPYFVGISNAQGRFQRRTPKYFYVSPFIDLDLEFDFRLAIPGEKLDLQINDFDASGMLLTSHLGGIRQPLTSGSLLWLTLKYPLITLKVISLIHWQALKLWLAKIPHRAKAARPEDQRGVFNPHPSIAGEAR